MSVKSLREQMAVLSNDIEAIERSLLALGYKGEFRCVAPRGNRVVFFHRDELRRFCIDEMRGTNQGGFRRMLPSR